jgi:hypothetical protein
MPNDILVEGTFKLSILSDGKHVNMRLTFSEPQPEELKQWLKFTYCNDLVWRHHAGGGSNHWFSTVTMDLYRKLFRHVQGEQYLVPGAD